MPPSVPGAPTVLESQAARLRIPAKFATICRHDPELHKLGFLLGQIFEKLQNPHNRREPRPLPDGERPQVLAAFAQYEEFHQKLHLRAAACDAMLAAAYARFGMTPPTRSYALTAESDVVETTPPIADAETAEQEPPIAETVITEATPVVAKAITPIVEVERPVVTPAHKVPAPALTPVKQAGGKHGNA